MASNINKYKKESSLQGIAISVLGAVDREKGVIGGASALNYIHGPN